MSSEIVVYEIGAAQCVPSDYSDQSRIRKHDSHRPWETDLSQARDFDFTGERGHAVRGVGNG